MPQSSDKPAGDAAPAEKNSFAAPSISLPKGGGAVKGIGEKFAANPVTGTGSLSVPLPASPGRGGFGPSLALSYDSGSGNGVFGFGWGLGLPSITRKTDKGLPLYQDSSESDTFILSGAEDLVPNDARPVITRGDYRVHSYRPRIEGLFARIERWTNTTDPRDVHWRSISKDNITTLYGKTKNARIFDPMDASRIFTWLICESFDDKGNAIKYEYVEENLDNVVSAQANETNRKDTLAKPNRYLKRVLYGNQTSRLVQPDLEVMQWHFELVLDYGDHDLENPTPSDHLTRPVRPDPFSSYRSGFEVRTYRRCLRVLMFHRFERLGAEAQLVRSLELDYADLTNPTSVLAELEHQGSTRIGSFLTKITVNGHRRTVQGQMVKRAMPSLELKYSRPKISTEVRTLQEGNGNLPYGVDGRGYQWLDLNSEGLSGVLTEQASAWFFKPNLGEGRLGASQVVLEKPNTSLETRTQFLDLAGDGLLDLVQFNQPVTGVFERTAEDHWNPLTSFRQLPNLRWDDPNLRFVDLTGDGHADVLITEDDVIAWHPSMAEAGFGPRETWPSPFDEERGPRVIFSDTTQVVQLADLSGDGLSDLVRIRNGEVCYWPNLGYGRFGAKVTMDNAPLFDATDQFNPARIRLADTDGSGATDILYLHARGVRLYMNFSGNAWSETLQLEVFPQVDNLSDMTVVDLLGNGTACLVWSSPLPGNVRAPLRYVDLMGGQKPHLLVSTINNMGAETRVRYVASTKFYLQDRLEGRPWVTRLPFPVHVIERVETYDRISRNRFVTRHAYHHGFFDGIEREFRGFGMVEQWDTEEIGSVLPDDLESNDVSNWNLASFVPPVYTKTWFHTGAYLGRERISHLFAHEYFAAPGATHLEPEAKFDDFERSLLPDTVLPENLSLEEEREACRSLKGSILRQEVYALDGTDGAERPYNVSERNYTITRVQARGENRFAVFFTHARETVDFHYERKLYTVVGDQIVSPENAPPNAQRAADPRVQHSAVLEVDGFGNVLRSVAIGYGRRFKAPHLNTDDHLEQSRLHATFTQNSFTNEITGDDQHRLPMPCESKTFELLHLKPPSSLDGAANLFKFKELDDLTKVASDGAHDVPYEDLDAVSATEADQTYRRLIEHERTLYRANDLQGLLPFKTLQSLALPGEGYKLAFTPELLSQTYGNRLPNPATPVLQEAGYVLENNLWWLPTGQMHYSPDPNDVPAAELTFAQSHFFTPHRYRDPFGHDTVMRYDKTVLIPLETMDALQNKVTSGEREAVGTITPHIDYRVLQPSLVTDPNGNRSEVRFDTLGMVAQTAVMGKTAEDLGDQLGTLEPDLSLDDLRAFAANPRVQAISLLGTASTRIVYDLERYQRIGQPPFAASIARETHTSDPVPASGLKVQIGIVYSDGFGRELQSKMQAEAGDAPQRQANITIPDANNPGNRPDIQPDIQPGALVLEAGVPKQTATLERWVGTGRTVYNNKGKPIKKYEPFFSGTHLFEAESEMNMTGVTPIMFYDPLERVVATLHPNHTYEKVVFDAWSQQTWDVNDTIREDDPRTDPDVGTYFARLPSSDFLPTWHTLRTSDALALARWPENPQHPEWAIRASEKRAAELTWTHGQSPSTAHLDCLGRTFLTLAHNGFETDDTPRLYRTRMTLDIEGNERAVTDANNHKVMTYAYDLLGHRIHQASMEAGERWMLNDVMSKPVRAFNSRGFTRRLEYDELRRPTKVWVKQGNGPERLSEQTIYGEGKGAITNHRGQVLEVRDGAGIVTSVRYDFKGNLVQASRQLLQNHRAPVNWNTNPALEAEVFSSSTFFDALKRPVQIVPPHSDQPSRKINVIRHEFNEANLLERIHIWLDQATAPSTLLNPATASTHGIQNLDYNAKGQRTRLEYKNGTVTTYDYDPQTFRLTRLETKRGNRTLQGLTYTYDPSGNITRIYDDAHQVINNNGPVKPENLYTYDAIYRLTSVSGREHTGQMNPLRNPNKPDQDFNDFPLERPAPNDIQAMRNYNETYQYDPVGNIREVNHAGQWTRTYTYTEPSLLEPANFSNRLSSTQVGASSETYTYTDTLGQDVQGCMTSINAMTMHWDDKDQLHQVDLGGGGTAYYIYDASGERTRKVIEKNNGNIIEERLYLGGFEIFRRNNTDTIQLERQTLHVMDDKQRIAMIETRTVDLAGDDQASAQLVRYQLSNHLGSSSLELDDQGLVISFEEYHPYGTSAYKAVRSQSETSKRYRYTGKERDEESGFAYHGARYYAVWIGKWTCCDPIRILTSFAGKDKTSLKIDKLEEEPQEDDEDKSKNEILNLYRYCKNNPVLFIDLDGNDPASKIAQQAGKSLLKRFFSEMGEKGARLAASRVSKVALKELSEGLAVKVEKHILEHTEEIAGKAAHSIFKSGTTKGEILSLITDTVKTGGKAVLSRTEGGGFAWVFEKEFKDKIGSNGQKILRVVVDKEGRVITAFPVEGLIKRMSVKGIQVSAQLATVAFVAGIYEKEAKAVEADYAARYKARDDSKTWLETGLEWIVPFGLAESSPIGLEPNFGKINSRSAEAIADAEKEFGRKLTTEESSFIHQEIYNIWSGSPSRSPN